MSVTDKLLDHFRGAIDDVHLLTSSGGAFEVKVNDKKIYSKLDTGKFPDPEFLIEEIKKMDLK